MESDHVRFESAVSASSSGNLTWGTWSHECIVALGLAGRRNPLGFCVVRYLTDPPRSANALEVVLVLAKEMERRGVPKEQSGDLAWKSFDFWRDGRCPKCFGRGVSSIEQRQCNTCAGTGKRSDPTGNEAVSIGIECLRDAERMMEGQQAARLRGAKYQEPVDGRRLNLATVGGNISDMGGSPVTARAPSHD